MENSLKELLEIIGAKNSNAPIKIDCFAVVILPAGFSYVGDLSFNNDTQHYEVKNAANIRRHTGGKGLGYYILNGQNDTITLDKCGDFATKNIISYHPTNKTKWKI